MIQANHRKVGFEISVSARDDGTLEALYITLLDGEVTRTEEVLEDVLLADYNDDDELIGIEVLAPVKLRRLAELVEEHRRPNFKRFLRQQAPEELVLA